jgi:phosphate-selective porin OprO and OprP
MAANDSTQSVQTLIFEGERTVSNTTTRAALAMAMLGLSGAALADSAETRGGLKVKSDDGRFEFGLGGRIHYDTVSMDDDGSGTYTTEGGSYFRRARLTLSGRAQGWEFKFENEFADTIEIDTALAQDEERAQSSFRDMYIARSVPGGKLTLGQFKPLRGMEELTSSNEITMMERPFASASGIFSGRQFAQGVKYQGEKGEFTYGVALQTNSVLKGNDSRITEEPVATARFTFAPLNTDTTTLHVGLSAGMENGDAATGARLRGRGKLPAIDIGTSRTLAEAGLAAGADEKDARHVGLELAGAFGPVHAQAEYILASYTDAYVDGSGNPADADVAAYYLMAGFFVTGEHKPYKGGVFKSPKPAGPMGAVELKARYDFAENRDQPTTPTNERELSVLTVGANWYLTSNLRFMLEHSMAEDRTTQVSGAFVEPASTALRAQFSF